MREILFRGKRIDNGEWTQGFFFQIWEKAFILRGTTNGVPNMIEVDPLTIGPFTGLTDKNGKKIFEGDIIRVTFESDCLAGCEPECWSELCEVFYDNEHHAWFTKINDEIGEWLYEYDGECEVISNIHDNPELGGDA